MGWMVRYGLPDERLDRGEIIRAARLIARELGAELRVQEADDDLLQTWFTIPMAALVEREDSEFDLEITASRLRGALALTVVATFIEGPRACLFHVESDDAANDLCYRTAVWVARHLSDQLGGRPL